MTATWQCLAALKKKRESRLDSLPSLRRQWVNWTVVLFLQLLNSVGYWTFLPTMHQFITNPTKSELTQNHRHHLGTTLYNTHSHGWPANDDLNMIYDTDDPFQINSQRMVLHVWLLPGLGDTEYVYSWVVTAFAIGEVVGAAVAGLLSTFLPYHITVPMVCVVHIIAGVLYVLTTNSIMIFIARFLMGFFGGYSLVLLSSYIGESAERFEGVTLENKTLKGKITEKRTLSHLVKSLREGKKKTRTRKDLLFIINAFSRAISNFIMLGVASVIAHFPRIHQFRWPGWLVIVTTSVYTVVFVLVFEQPHQCYRKDDSKSDLVDETDESDSNDDIQSNRHKTKSSWKGTCCSLNLFKNVLVYSFILLTGYIGGSIFTVMDTLLNPILSDHFGFTIVDISYFILVATALPILAVILLAIVKTFAIDNRKVLAGAICSAIIGGIIMSDWQALSSGDPCSTFNHDQTLNNTITTDSNSSELIEIDNSFKTQHDLRGFANLSVSEITDLCVNASTSEHTCYWNPRSRITGKYCSDCTQRCNSIQQSLYFAQLCVGWMMIMLVLPITPVLVNVIASDYTPIEYQGVIMGAILVASGFSRIISPLWSDWTYEATNKHTYAVMTVKSTTLSLVLILLLVFYKLIGPKSSRTSKLGDKTVKRDYITATNSKHEENRQLRSRSVSSSGSDYDEDVEQ